MRATWSRGLSSRSGTGPCRCGTGIALRGTRRPSPRPGAPALRPHRPECPLCGDQRHERQDDHNQTHRTLRANGRSVHHVMAPMGSSVTANWWSPGTSVDRGRTRVLAKPGVGFAVLETARGGLLLRGMSVSRVDVAVVTNVAADHLGSHGINTVEQLAMVKATVVRIVDPEGWTVLNADEPLVTERHRPSSPRAAPGSSVSTPRRWGRGSPRSAMGGSWSRAS